MRWMGYSGVRLVLVEVEKCCNLEHEITITKKTLTERNVLGE